MTQFNQPRLDVPNRVTMGPGGNIQMAPVLPLAQQQQQRRTTNPTLANFRQQYPQYNDIDDIELMQGIVAKFPQYAPDFSDDLARWRFQKIAGEEKPPDYEQQRGRFVQEQANQQLQQLLDAERMRPGGRDTRTYAGRSEFYREGLPEGYMDQVRQEAGEQFDAMHSPMARYHRKRQQIGEAILEQHRMNHPDASDEERYRHMHLELLKYGFNPSFSGQMGAITQEVEPGEFERGLIGEAASGVARFPMRTFQGGAQMILATLAEVENRVTGRRPEQGFGFFEHLDASTGHFGRDIQHSLRASDKAQGFNPGNVNWWVANTAEMVPIVGSFAVNPLAGTAVVGLAETSVYQDLKDSLEAQGYSKDEARLRALSGAAAIGTTNALLQRFGFDRVAAAWQAPFRNAIAGWTAKWLAAGAAEGATEALQELTHILVSHGIDAQSYEAQDIYRMVEAGGTGALMGLLFAGAGSGIRRAAGYGSTSSPQAQHQAMEHAQETLAAEFDARMGALEQPTPGRDSTAATQQQVPDPNTDPNAPLPRPDAEGVLSHAAQLPTGEHVIAAEPEAGPRPAQEAAQTPPAGQQPQPTQPPAEVAPTQPAQAQPPRDPMRGIRRTTAEISPERAAESQLVRSDTREGQPETATAEQVAEMAVQADPDVQADPSASQAYREYFAGELRNLKRGSEEFVRVELPLEHIQQREGYQPGQEHAYAAQDPATAPPVIGGLPQQGDKVTLVDGNTRVRAAAQRGDATVTAYIPRGDIQELGLTSPQAQATARARKAEEAVERLYDEARTDPLTGLGNKKKYDEALQDYRQRADETGQPMSVIVMDAANLKAANDVLGHEGADNLIRKIADDIASAVRTQPRDGGKPDVVTSRQGGDEFSVILPDTDAAGARQVLQRIQESVGEQQIVPGLSMFIAGDVATYTPGADLTALIRQADRGAEAAKEARKQELGEPTTRSEAEALVARHRQQPQRQPAEPRLLDTMREKPQPQDIQDAIERRGEREWRDNAEQTGVAVDFGVGEGQRWVQRTPVPELVEFYRDLTGEYPQALKRLLTTGTLGFFHPKDGKVRINPIMALDSRALAKTLAHEIGHLIDYLPQKAIRDRTNLLGRLAAVRKYTDKVFGEHKGEDVQKELETLSHRWREEIPSEFAAAMDLNVAEFRAYRVSGPELYADFVSIMLNDPALAKQMAPKSFDLWTKGLKNKGEYTDWGVLESYLMIQDLLGGTPADLARRRSRRVKSWFEQTDDVLKQAVAERAARDQSLWGSFLQTFIDSGAPVMRTIKSRPGQNPTRAQYALGEFDLVDQEAGLMMQKAERAIAKPLRDAGVPMRSFSEWLMMNRIAEGDRAKYINPGGFTKEEAATQRKWIEDQMSPEQKKALQDASKAFYDITYDIARKLYQEGAYSAELFQRITDNKGKYAYFAVLDHLVDRADWNVKEQVGTFKPVGDPFVTTMMKAVAMANMYERQKLRNVLLPELRKAGVPVEVKKITRWSKQPKADANESVIMHWQGGKAHWVKLPKQYADAMKRMDLGSLARFTRLLTKGTYRTFHDLYVTMNLGWMTMNVPRDMKATIGGTAAHAWRKHGFGKSLEAIPKTLLEYVRNAPAALRHARGRYDKLAEEMMENRALANIKVADLMRNKEQADYDTMWRQEFGDLKRSKHIVGEFLSRAYDAFVVGANFTETWSKMAGYRTLQDMGFSGQELAHIVRNDVGTPNIYQKGLATSLTNSMFMYQKVAVNGWRRDLRLATDKETAPGRWLAWMLTSGMGRLAMIGAAYGLFGEELKEYFDAIPEYEKSNFIIIPLPWSRNKDGVVGYLRLPEDHTERWFGGIMWKLAMAAQAEDRQELERDIKDILAFSGAQVPGLSTTIKLPMAWIEYLQGGNPRDDWTKRHILSRDAHAAGGQAAFAEMMHWSAGQFGMLTDIIKPLIGDHWEPRNKGAIETAVEWVPGVNRLVRFSDRGTREAMWEQEAAEEARSAAFRLSLEPQGDVRRLLRMRHQFNRLTGGRNPQTLSRREYIQQAILNDYYRGYLELTQAIREAELAGRDASRARARLKDMTERFKTLVQEAGNDR